MKKVISVFLAVILALSTFAFGTTVSFADEQNDFYYEDDYSTPDQSVISDISVSARRILKFIGTVLITAGLTDMRFLFSTIKQIRIIPRLMLTAITITVF